MNRDAWVVFAALASMAAIVTLGFTAWRKHERVLRSEIRIVELQNTVETQAARLAEAWKEVELCRSRAETLATEVAAASQSHRQLEAEMREALTSRDIAVSELQGRLTVTILDRILFDSGDATIKPEGMKLLDEVAKILARYTNRPVQVFGHTDNVPIRVRYPSNWELSTARAVAAVRYLAEKAGVQPSLLSAVGCGEFQPIADNSTPEGRARNRRIALVVLPESFVPTDVPSEGQQQEPDPAPRLTESDSPAPASAEESPQPAQPPVEDEAEPTAEELTDSAEPAQEISEGVETPSPSPSTP
jgi:flagellar motor protein MotB